jgi:hypothetical protein
MKQTGKGSLIQTILKAVALALAVATIVLNILGAGTVQTSISLLSIALLAFVLASFI